MKVKKRRVSWEIDQRVYDLIRLACARGNSTQTKVIEYCVKKVLLDPEKAIKDKIAYHTRKVELWKETMKENKEMKEENGVGMRWEFD